MRRCRYGFTLTELLTVLGTIGLLAALLLPVLSQARAAAYRAPCTANLHELSRAFAAYFEDNDQFFPPCNLGTIQSLADLDSFWFRQIGPYLKSQAVFHCPADNVQNARRALSGALPRAWDQPGLPALSYGANWDMMTAAVWGVPQANTAALPNPALTLLVADCSEPWAYGPVYVDDQGVRWSHIAYANGPPVAWAATVFHGGRSGMGHERHEAGSNIAYFDGHVGYLPAAQFYCRTLTVTDSSGKHRSQLIERPLLSPRAVPPEEVPGPQ
jgi:prepilin-type processing-associated H-X9-DG protein